MRLLFLNTQNIILNSWVKEALTRYKSLQV